MHKLALTKPDGRYLLLYARHPLPESLPAPVPGAGSPGRGSELRWHPLRGEWVAYASHRQNRTFLPPPEFNPLAPTVDPQHPTEVPAGDWEVAVFENLFPTLSAAAADPPPSIVDTRPGRGACEVVVFTQDPESSLGALPLAQIELILEVWAERTRELGARDDVLYVFPFENRGVEVGVTLHHPHGQIYAYPFVPPIPARELELQRAHLEAHGSGLLEDLIGAELADGRRMLYTGERAVAWLPVCARYPYEVWIAPRRAAPTVDDLDPAERADFARALKTVLLKYDRLWDRPFPYVLVLHQAPTDSRPHPEAHLHVEIYPPLRMPNRLKFLAGSELGAGAFTADTLPEDKAAELNKVEVEIDKAPEVRADASGRVNLIGEHTDYSGGFVMPLAIPQRTRVTLTRREGTEVHAWSAEMGGKDAGPAVYRLGEEAPGRGWLDYVQGITRVLAQARYRLGGFDLRVESDVPLGAGLSSSAALEIALLKGLRELFDLPLPDLEMAHLGQRAENEFVGAPVGIMDQMAATFADPETALFLDTRSLAFERVPLPAEAELAVIDSGIAHAHSDGDYRTRRNEVEETAARLEVAELRDAGLQDLDRIARLPPPLDRRARHVVTENARVLAAVEAMRAGDLPRLGELLDASHRSLRDDFEVSVPEVDLLVELARGEPGVFGARMTGGGFGGSIVVLARRGEARAAAERAAAAYRERTGREARVLLPQA